MDTKVLLVIAGSYAAAGFAYGLMAVMYRRKSMAPFFISDDAHRSASNKELYLRVLLNSAVSIGLIATLMVFLGTYFVYDRPVQAWRYPLEFVTVVLIYDFAYYFMHRYLFHEWKILRGVHSVHHAARNPRVIDALLLHPVETCMGLGLFFGSMALVGGVHLYTMAVLIVAYSGLNILNHAGMDIPRFPFKTLGVLAAKHDRHHHSMLSGNYASITPLPDILFGTVE